VGEEHTVRVASLSANILAILRSISEAITAHNILLCEGTGSLLEDRTVLSRGRVEG